MNKYYVWYIEKEESFYDYGPLEKVLKRLEFNREDELEDWLNSDGLNRQVECIIQGKELKQVKVTKISVE